MLKTGKCIRNAINFTKQEKYQKFDKPYFNMQIFNNDLDVRSPKMVKLLSIIKKLDENDMHNDGHYYKHIIYCDNKTSNGGIKMIAGSLISNGFKNIYQKKLQIDKNLYLSNKTNNFALLTSLSIYDKPFPVKLKSAILSDFNERPNNIYGDNIRFLLIDQGYKEGIDVYDVKYLHLFDDLLTDSDYKQVIGRGTRHCGQKGLDFNPVIGWPLHVFKYNLLIPDKLKKHYDAENSFEIVMRESGLDINKLIFANELETVSIKGAVDNGLNKIINEYKNIKDPLMGAGIKGTRKKLELKGYKLHKKSIKITRKLSYDEMYKHINRYFKKYKWDEIKFENGCIDNIKDNSRIVTFTRTQDFVSHYFNYKLPYKGMLFWHSVGTGKTCSAIATATRGFELAGYTILWVTRHTLKQVIWKNMFDKICSVILQKQYEDGKEIPFSNTKNRLKYLSDSWQILPISYKQFSNLLEEKNIFYKKLVSINGKKDPLRKTLVIIDEAHLLYSNELKIAEKPNINILSKKIKYSYEVSGDDSVRLLFMTATPYTTNPMDLIKFINLMKEDSDDLLPENFDEFKRKFLNDSNKFTLNGHIEYLNSITGYISYLNRENDIRQFAYPVIHNVNVEMSTNIKDPKINDIEDEIMDLSEKFYDAEKVNDQKKIQQQINKLKKEIKKINIKQNKDSINQELVFNKCLNIDSIVKEDIIKKSSSDKEIDPITDKSVPKCKDGKEIHPITSKCVPKCKDGKERNEKGRCVSSKKMKKDQSPIES